jgi:hypothetical protein
MRLTADSTKQAELGSKLNCRLGGEAPSEGGHQRQGDGFEGELPHTQESRRGGCLRVKGVNG